jgi:hypothetical protein
MTSPLHTIEGLTVTEAEVVHDYVQLAFGDEIGISIYNEMEVSPKSTRFEALAGKTVTAVTEREEAIEIKFLDGTLLTIDMHRQAYRGPEALELNRRGYPPVIWN